MVVLVMTMVVVVVVTVFKVLVWAGAAIKMGVIVLAIDVCADVKTDMLVIAVAIALNFPAPSECSADVLSNMVTEALAAVKNDIMVVSAVEILTDMNIDRFADIVTVLEFFMPTALEGLRF